MHVFLSKHFKKPEGLLGRFVSRMLIKFNSAVYDAIEKKAELSNNLNIFEIGYGPGYGITYLSSKYELNYSGIDFSELMFKQATKRVKRSRLEGQVNLDYGDFLESNYPSGKQDRVIFSNVTYFWDDLTLPFSKIQKMLRKDGKLVFYMSGADRLKERDFTSTEHFIHHEIGDVKEKLMEVGFKNVEVEEGEFEHTGRYIVIANN